MQLNLPIAILIFYFVGGMTQIILNRLKMCTCEELLYEEECDLSSSCQFLNNTCSSLKCSEMKSKTACNFNKNCAWHNNECSDFQSCSYYNVSNTTSCRLLNDECQYNPFTKLCDRYDKVYTKLCSETTKEECYHGSDGICKYENEQCSKLTSCGSVSYNDTSCYFAEPACYCNIEKQECESRIGCQKKSSFSCWFAAVTIDNPYLFYLCQEPAFEGQCEDWNPDNQSKENCLLNSMGFYHWNGNSCEVCRNSNALILLLANIIVILIQ